MSVYSVKTGDSENKYASSADMHIINHYLDMNKFCEKIKSLIRKKQRLQSRTKVRCRSINPQVMRVGR